MFNPTDLRGLTCLITGANSGLGYATALELARREALVVMVCRDRTRGEAARSEIVKATGNAATDLLVADLEEQRELCRLAQMFLGRFPRLDVLIHNAAVFLPERQVTPDGLETMFAVNYLAPFLLTHLLLERLQASAPARVIAVTTAAAGPPNLADLQGAHDFNARRAYEGSKSAGLLFICALARRLAGRGVTANAFDPGAMRTRLGRGTGWLADPPEHAAGHLVQLAVSERFASASGQLLHEGRPQASRLAREVTLQEKLWAASLKLAGLAMEPAQR